MAQANATNFCGVNQYVVNSSGAVGAYTTIQSAIDAALADGGGAVMVTPGSYTEDLDLYASVYLVGSSVAHSYDVTIIGTITMTDITGNTGIQDIAVSVSGAGVNCLNISNTVAGTPNIYLQACVLQSAGGKAISMTSGAGVTSTIYANNAEFSGATTTLDFSGTGGMQARNSQMNCSGTAIASLGASSSLNTFYSIANSSGQGYVINDATASLIVINSFGAYADELVNFAAAGTATIINSGFQCTAASTNWAIGAAGTLVYGGLSVVVSYGIAAGLTQIIAEELPRAKAGNSSTATRGFSGFDSDDFSATDGFISLNSSTTWTPGISFGGGTTGITYTSQEGYYQQTGDVVFINATIVLSNKGSSTGSAAITGLPVTTGSNGNTNSIFVGHSNLTLTVLYTDTMGIFSNSGNTIDLNQIGSGQAVATVDDTNFANNTSIYITGIYLVT